MARYLVEDYCTRMPLEPCQACGLSVMDRDPAGEAMNDPNSDLRPMRVFCGHWLHFKCLNTWLTTPPFVRNCPACREVGSPRKINHPDWSDDIKTLERAWQNKQAKLREVSDVSDFMDMGGDFSTDAAKAGKFG